MTVFKGHTLIASPCCGAIYKTKASAPTHFSARGYWTDGAEEDGLAPTDGGLRVCQCGTAFLMRDATSLGLAADPEIPFPTKPSDDQLPEIIKSASSPSLEVTARRNYWRHLNDGYRREYRALREKEDAISRAYWYRDYYASLPILRRLVCKLLSIKPKWDFPQPSRPFNVPPYQPSLGQLENMTQLLGLILARAEAPLKIDWLEIAELHRELSEFDAAGAALRECTADYQRGTKTVIGHQVELGSAAPIRYRL